MRYLELDGIPSLSRVGGLFTQEALARAAPLFATLHELADAHGATPAQVALAWVIRHPNVVAIVGASNADQAAANAAAADLELEPAEVVALSEAASAFGRARARR